MALTSASADLRRVVLTGPIGELRTTVPTLPPRVEHLHLKSIELQDFSSANHALMTFLLTCVTMPEPDGLLRCLKSAPAVALLGFDCVRSGLSPSTLANLPPSVKHIYSNASATQEALATIPATVSSLTYIEPAHFLTRRSQLSTLSYACSSKGIHLLARRKDGGAAHASRWSAGRRRS